MSNVLEKLQQNVIISALSSIKSSFNNISVSFGSSRNNTVNNNYNFAAPSTSVIKDYSTMIEDNTTIYDEAFPNDHKIMKFIWKYLPTEEKLNCTVVCKRFNQIISEMDCFRLVVYSPYIIPKLSRQYKTVIFQCYKSKKNVMC